MARNHGAVDDGAVTQARDARLAVERRVDVLPIDLLNALDLILLDAELREEALRAFSRIVRGLAAESPSRSARSSGGTSRAPTASP